MKNTNTEITMNMQLHDGTWVDQWLYESILQRIKMVLPTLDRNKKYKIEDLCGKDFWSQLEKIDRINAGKCLVHMVRNGLLPLILVEKNAANTQLYRLK